MQKEIREIRRDLYGNPQVRQKGVYDRLEKLEEDLHNLRSTYEREKVEQGFYARLEAEVDQLRFDYRLTILYLRGIAAAVGTITVTLVAAALVAVFRFLGGS